MGEEKLIRCSASEGFAAWMSNAGGSLCITTYQANRIVLVGWNGKEVTVLPRKLSKPMGVASNGSVMAVACRHEVVFFANAGLLAPHYPKEGSGRYDALFLPRSTYLTGDVNVHDVGFGSDGLWLVNTRFSCLCQLSRGFSFEPRWHPGFVSRLTPEDRCHLNGLGMLDGRPKFVTAHGMTDGPGEWREGRAAGVVLLDVDSGTAAVSGLSMPHSPRYHNGKWWLLNSGTGELCQVDPEAGRWETVCALPGYARGLCFSGRFAIVGLSQVRSSHLFDGMAVQQRFAQLHCGAAVVDLDTGQNLGMFEFTDGCDELYDVQFLPGISRPSILNQENPATGRAVTAPDLAYWLLEEEDKPSTIVETEESKDRKETRGGRAETPPAISGTRTQRRSKTARSPQDDA